MFNHQSHCDDCSGYFQSFELCKNVNCNGHGSCVLGVCKCRQGWRGSSCNIASSCTTLQCGLKSHEYCYNGNECVCVRGYVRNKVTKACEVPKLVATTTQINIASTTTPAPKFLATTTKTGQATTTQEAVVTSSTQHQVVIASTTTPTTTSCNNRSIYSSANHLNERNGDASTKNFTDNHKWRTSHDNARSCRYKHNATPSGNGCFHNNADNHFTCNNRSIYSSANHLNERNGDAGTKNFVYKWRTATTTQELSLQAQRNTKW